MDLVIQSVDNLQTDQVEGALLLKKCNTVVQMKFIKFALGENVKRSGSQANNRYPDSRMGVSRSILTPLPVPKQRAKAKDPSMVRKDLELDA